MPMQIADWKKMLLIETLSEINSKTLTRNIALYNQSYRIWLAKEKLTQPFQH